MSIDIIDQDSVQADFQDGTLTDVEADAGDYLRLTTVEEDGDVSEFNEPVAPSSHTAVTSPVAVGSYAREVVTTGTATTYDEIRYDNGSELAPSNTIFYVYLPNPGNGNWVFKLNIRDSGYNTITAISFDGNDLGDISLLNPSSGWDLAYSNYPANTWIKIEVVWDWSNDAYDFYVDDTLEVSAQGFRTSASGFQYWHENWDHDEGGITGYIDHVSYPYLGTGNRLSPQLDLSAVGTVDSSSISWTRGATSQTITIETRASLDGGSTWTAWTEATDGGSIPGLSAGDDVSNGLLECRQTLSTSDPTITPELSSLTLQINSSVVHGASLTVDETPSNVASADLENLTTVYVDSVSSGEEMSLFNATSLILESSALDVIEYLSNSAILTLDGIATREFPYWSPWKPHSYYSPAVWTSQSLPSTSWATRPKTSTSWS